MSEYGIDYSGGKANIDPVTGIHFGVIPAKDVGDFWYETSELLYDDISDICPDCGSQLGRDVPEDGLTNEEEARWCNHCEVVVTEHDLEMASEYQEASAIVYNQDGYNAYEDAGSHATSDDIFIERSPFFTYAAFCSPCAPGAVHLRDPLQGTDGPKGYCFGHDWFEGGVAPYDVYDVKTGELMLPEGQEAL